MDLRTAINALPNRQTNILLEKKNNRFWITLNRPKRRNAFSLDMYDKLTSALQYAATQPAIHYIVIRGAGNYFSSGNDLSNFSDPQILALGERFHPHSCRQSLSILAATVLSTLCTAIIESPKPIFGLVEGAAVGFAFTQLLLYDRVYATGDCVFQAPLVKLAQGPQMCASYTFPKVFGTASATDLLCVGRRVGAPFLRQYGVVEVGKDYGEIEKMLQSHLRELDQLEVGSYRAARALLASVDRQHLREANQKEVDNLVIRWGNPKLMEYIVRQMQKKEAKL